MSRYQEGQRVRVKETAWPGSTEPDDIQARGQIVTLLCRLETDDDDDPLWEAELPSGLWVYPVESEVEAVFP